MAGRPAKRPAQSRGHPHKSGFGLEAAHTSWLMHGSWRWSSCTRPVRVPRPLSGSDNAVLMTYHGHRRQAGPTRKQRLAGAG